MAEYIIDQAKLDRYLLDLRHPDGGPKCRLFLHFGFRIDKPTELADALIAHAQEHRVQAELRIEAIATKRVLFGPLTTPYGARPNAISVWEVLSDHERLITAYITDA